MGLSQAEVYDLIYDWFRKLTIKDSLDDMITMLDQKDLEMKFPERTLRNLEDFKDWFHTVTHLFFDQIHELKLVTVDIEGDEASIHLIVNWQARTWTPPAGFSEWQGWLIKQDWIVRRSSETGKAVIHRYAVLHLDPMNPVH
jgi:hypothetical protein